MLEDEFTLYIYTDGSALYHPRYGGVGILFVYSAENGKERFYELNPLGYKGATSIQMELQACVLALKEAHDNNIFSKYKNIVIYSDSQFLIDNYERAEKYWSRNKWTLINGSPVINADLWKEFLKAKKKLGKQVEIQKVKAHSTNIHNNRVDRLAKNSAKFPAHKPLQVIQVNRKFSKKLTEKGSIKMFGQILSIHIIQRQYFHEHKIDGYRYEVVDKDSKYYECVDFIFSKTHMKRNHCYEVRVNENQDYPQVLEIIREFEIDK